MIASGRGEAGGNPAQMEGKKNKMGLKEYEAPEVVEYGHVKDIVLGAFSIEGFGESLGSIMIFNPGT